MPPLTGRLLKHLTVPRLVSFHGHFTLTNPIRICLWVDNIANLHCLRETVSVCLSLCCVFPPVIMSTKLPWVVNVYFHVHLYCISGIHSLTGKNWKWSMFPFLWVNGDVSYTLRMACYPVTNYNRSLCCSLSAVFWKRFRKLLTRLLSLNKTFVSDVSARSNRHKNLWFIFFPLCRITVVFCYAFSLSVWHVWSDEFMV